MKYPGCQRLLFFFCERSERATRRSRVNEARSAEKKNNLWWHASWTSFPCRFGIIYLAKPVLALGGRSASILRLFVFIMWQSMWHMIACGASMLPYWPRCQRLFLFISFFASEESEQRATPRQQGAKRREKNNFWMCDSIRELSGQITTRTTFFA